MSSIALPHIHPHRRCPGATANTAMSFVRFDVPAVPATARWARWTDAPGAKWRRSDLQGLVARILEAGGYAGKVLIITTALMSVALFARMGLAVEPPYGCRRSASCSVACAARYSSAAFHAGLRRCAHRGAQLRLRSCGTSCSRPAMVLEFPSPLSYWRWGNGVLAVGQPGPHAVGSSG